ncbi:MAG: RnfH family protein [Lysobacterales bacterium]
MAETVRVEVAYALAERQWLLPMLVAEGSTAIEAVVASGILELAGIKAPLDLGVHGRRVSEDTPLRAGDRVEIYRGLHFDPMESRRRRAAKSQARR